MRTFGFFFFFLSCSERGGFGGKGEVMSFVIAAVVVCMRAYFAKKEVT